MSGRPAVWGTRPSLESELGPRMAPCSSQPSDAQQPPDDHCALTRASNCWPSVAHAVLTHSSPSLLTGQCAVGVLSPRVQKGKPRHEAGRSRGWRWQTEVPHTCGAEVCPTSPQRLRTRPGPSCCNSLHGAGAVGSAEGFPTGEPEKGLGVGTAWPAVPDDCPCLLRETPRRFCPRIHVLDQDSQVQEASEEDGAARALAPAPTPAQPPALSASSTGCPSRLQRGVRSKLGHRAGMAC